MATIKSTISTVLSATTTTVTQLGNAVQATGMGVDMFSAFMSKQLQDQQRDYALNSETELQEAVEAATLRSAKVLKDSAKFCSESAENQAAYAAASARIHKIAQEKLGVKDLPKLTFAKAK